MRLGTWYYDMVHRCTRLTTFFLHSWGFWGSFPMERSSAQGPQNEIWWKEAILMWNLFIFFFGEKMVHVVIEGYFSFISEGFWRFFITPNLSLIVHFVTWKRYCIELSCGLVNNAICWGWEDWQCWFLWFACRIVYWLLISHFSSRFKPVRKRCSGLQILHDKCFLVSW